MMLMMIIFGEGTRQFLSAIIGDCCIKLNSNEKEIL